MDTDSAIIRLPHSVGGWDMAGALQRTCDVDFAISLPFWIPLAGNPSYRLSARLECRIYYDPASDDCLLVNESEGSILLTDLSPTWDEERLLHFQRHIMSPGIWRIPTRNKGTVRQHLVDFLVLRRRFTVNISEALAGLRASTKHPVPGDDAVSTKRGRREDDVSKILLAPTTYGPKTTFIPNPTATPGQQIVRSGGTPLSDLLDREVAIVKTIQPKSPETDCSSSPAVPTRMPNLSSPATYESRRLGSIADTPSSSVFVGQHSELPEIIVAKINR